jgi:hypothetical protein
MKKVILSIFSFAFSTALFAQTQEAFPTGDFETWENYSAPNTSSRPAQFNSLNAFTAVGLGIVTCGKGTAPNVHGGTYSVRLKSVASALAPSGVIQGMITTGEISITNFNITSGIAFTSRPDSVVSWIKYAPALNGNNITDTGYVEILLLNGDDTDTIGRGRINVYQEITGFTRYSSPINYFNNNTPVKLRAILNASSGYSPVANSEIFIDDAAFIYNPIGFNEVSKINCKVYPNPAIDKLFITYNENESGTITLSNPEGKVVSRKSIDNREIEVDINNLPVGNYLYTISTASGKSFSGKVSITR